TVSSLPRCCTLLAPHHPWRCARARLALACRAASVSGILPSAASLCPRVQRGAAAFGVGGHLVGHLDPHAQQCRGVCLAQVVAAQAARTASAQCLLHHELEGEEVAGLEALHVALHQLGEVLLHPLGSHHVLDRFIGGVVVGEQGEVGDVSLVTTACATEIDQLNTGHVRSPPPG